MKNLKPYLVLFMMVVLQNCFATQKTETSQKYIWQGIKYKEASRKEIISNKSKIKRLLFSGARNKNEIVDIYYDTNDLPKIKQVLKNLKKAKKTNYINFDGDLLMFQYDNGTGAYLLFGVDHENEYCYGRDFKSKDIFKTLTEWGFPKLESQDR